LYSAAVIYSGSIEGEAMTDLAIVLTTYL